MNAHDPQIAALLDREAIRDLPILYCHQVWRNDVEAIVSLFAKDGRLIIPENLGPDGVVTGSAALLAFYRRGLAGQVAGIAPRPFIHNHVVELLGDGRARGWAYAEIRNGHEGFRVTQMIVYEDSYAKEGGAWKFAERNVIVTHVPARGPAPGAAA